MIDPSSSDLKPELVDAFVERRKGKATKEQAEELLENVNYFGTMLVYTGKAAGLVSGCCIQLVTQCVQLYKLSKQNRACLKLLVFSS